MAVAQSQTQLTKLSLLPALKTTTCKNRWPGSKASVDVLSSKEGMRGSMRVGLGLAKVFLDTGIINNKEVNRSQVFRKEFHKVSKCNSWHELIFNLC